MEQVIDTGLYRVDAESMIREWKSGVPNGQSSNIKALDEIFKWMPGTVSALYGRPNAGKGTFFDYLAAVRCMMDPTKKFAMFRQEDLSSSRFGNEKPKLTANRIHRGLMWTYTGKCPDKNFAEKYKGVHLSDKTEFMEAMSWVDEHFFVISPRDRSWPNVKKMLAYCVEEFGITDILIDPFKSLKLADDRRSDHLLDDIFIDAKEFVMDTNTTLTFIAHPRSDKEPKQSKDPNSPYRIITQDQIAGGAAWDNNMDQQYSLHRPHGHNNPNDPQVNLYNLKQRNSEEVLAQKGSLEGIRFDRLKRRYYFNGVCPITGETWTDVRFSKQSPIDFSEPKKKEITADSLPF